MVIKCKMCGGDLKIASDSSIYICQYCGSAQTIPGLGTDKKYNMFNRANRLRMDAEFGDAAAVFESITAEYPEEAEAYWGLVLCRYGIEYVDDPITGTKKPTCHRINHETIFSDSNYELSLRYADEEAKEKYIEEAKMIDRLQQEALKIVNNEQPYDVFICYKETDSKGERTEDSVLAQDIYVELNEKGLNVFFARISLETKLGQQYEPYIYAALYSARVMLVVGTSEENINAVWVKNEWSRFLQMMRTDRKKQMIPCYKHMNAYDLPSKMRNLQAQDMGKIGWLQDLSHGVMKLCEKDRKESSGRRTESQSDQGKIDALLQRAYLRMEDGDNYRAEIYIELALELDSTNADAYIARLCNKLQLHRASMLGETTFLYDTHPDWNKAMSFATPQQKKIYDNYYKQARTRVDRQIKERYYDCAVELAVNRKANEKALEYEIKHYTETCVTYDNGRADGSRRHGFKQNEAKYLKALKYHNPRWVSVKGYRSAAKLFHAAGTDMHQHEKECLNLAQLAKIRDHLLILLCLALVIIAACFFIPFINGQLAEGHYKRGLTYRENEQWASAVIEFKKAGDYADSAEQILETYYEEGLAKRTAREWDEAVAALLEAGSYKDAKEQIADVRYAEGRAKKAAGDWEDAIKAFEQAGTDAAKTQIAETRLLQGKEKQAAGDWEGAIKAFEQAGTKSAKTQISATWYTEGKAKQQADDWDGAVLAFEKAGDYSDAATQILKTRYTQGKAYYTAKNWEEAAKAFEKAGNYKDAETQMKISRYNQGKEKQDAEDWDGAVKAFSQAGDYKDAAKQILISRYKQGEEKRNAQDWNGAVKAFLLAEGYSDAAKQVLITRYKEGEYKREAQNWDDAVNAFELAGDYSDSTKQILVTRYKEGEAKRNLQDWDGAVAAFEAAGNYSDSVKQVQKTRYEEGKAKQAVQDWNGAISAFEMAGNYSDAAMQIKETCFLKAEVLIEKGKFEEAYDLYLSLGTYKDSNKVFDNNQNLQDVRNVKLAEGNFVVLGLYPQNQDGTDQTPIEWVVLKREENKVLLISRYALNCLQFNNTNQDEVSWENSSLRKWLNNEFLNSAFSENERNGVLNTPLDSENNQSFSILNLIGLNQVKDKVFLLSYDEVKEYFSGSKAMQCSPTRYTAGLIEQSGILSGQNCTWWLRSLSNYPGYIDCISESGLRITYHVGSIFIAVRPAVWISLDSGLF